MSQLPAVGAKRRGYVVRLGCHSPVKLAELAAKAGVGTERFAAPARVIEPPCMRWCMPGFRQNDRVHANPMLEPA